jgi:hypothetical protein
VEVGAIGLLVLGVVFLGVFVGVVVMIVKSAKAGK